MDFGLTEEQQGLVESTRSMLATKAPLPATRDLIDSEAGFDPDLWRLGAELGWPALAVPEADGGLGQGIVDLALVAVEHGRSLAATPFAPTVIVADAVVRSDVEGRSKILSSLVDGTETAAWSFAEHGQPWSLGGIQARAQRRSDGFVITGTKASVQDGGTAGWLLTDAMLDGQPARFVVRADTPGIRSAGQRTLDVTRSYCELNFDDAYVPADALCATGDAAATSIERSCRIGAVLASAELVGVGQQLLEMSVDYAGKRVQFGRPIGSFQAIKHKCADMRIAVQSATATTLYAAMTLDADNPDQAQAVSVAKVCASEAISRLAGEALQLHGGIGFTWEHDLHLYLRRARTNALLHGDATHHRELLCRLLEEATS
jgi:alkylation response protein AidB-like acyl-CoA dehydrogenase